MPQGASRIVVVTLAVMVAYLGAVAVDVGAGRDEALPFFTWSLFSQVPAREQVNFSIRLVEVDGRPLDPPRYFDEAGDLVTAALAPEANELAQAIGRRLEAGDEAGAEELLGLFESRFLNELDGASYEVVRRRYDVVDRLSCQCDLDTTVVGTFTLG
jgi:hypothetical protein